MPSLTITLDSHDEELAVLGSRDQFLRQVRDGLGVKVIARHGEVRVEGAQERVDQARQVFEGLRQVYQRRRAISAGDVAEAIEAAVGPVDGGQSGVVDLHSGLRGVRARTEGQGRYLQALRESELVLAIGPAGTGKTYLAVANGVSLLRQGRAKKIVLVRPAV